MNKSEISLPFYAKQGVNSKCKTVFTGLYSIQQSVIQNFNLAIFQTAGSQSFLFMVNIVTSEVISNTTPMLHLNIDAV